MLCTACHTTLHQPCNYCPSCGQGLTADNKHVSPAVTTRQKKFLIFLAIYAVAEPLLWKGIYLLMEYAHFSYNYVRPFHLLFALFFSLLPLIITLILPRSYTYRTALLIVSGIFAVLKLSLLILKEFTHLLY